MELKPYQQQVIGQLKTFINMWQSMGCHSEHAFNDYWKQRGVVPVAGKAIQPYQHRLKNRAPHICVKVPTAGGKTFIACNAIQPIMDSREAGTPQLVVWLVPSNAILEQTCRQLKNPDHPYRRRLNSQHGSIRVYEKAELLQGQGFQWGQVQAQLNILVLSFDSLRAKKKEDRKVYQENGNLHSFHRLFGADEEITLMAVINELRPVVIIDESHNAATELSTDMLDQLNPYFVLELTATPRKSSNIIEFIGSYALKQHHMVKLPLIVTNQKEKQDVILTAIQLRESLEKAAEVQHSQGGKYIRPIVLFQAQPKNSKTTKDNDEATTFKKIKEQLIKAGIPEGQIKIKTATINEIQGLDLLSPECEVRFIITINALKEGWDCPFAYVLASLADKTSTVDVTQIVGRILRQPYVTLHKEDALNLSYVITASSKFSEVLTNIIDSLKKVGFGDKDYREQDLSEQSSSQPIPKSGLLELFGHTSSNEDSAEDGSDVISDQQVEQIRNIINNNPETSQAVKEILLQTQTIQEPTETKEITAPEIKAMQRSYPIKTIFEADADILLPTFHRIIHADSQNLFFEEGENKVSLDLDNLLINFALSKQDCDIDFDQADSNTYQIDVNKAENDYYRMVRQPLHQQAREYLYTYMVSDKQKEAKVAKAVDFCLKELGNLKPISERELQGYVKRIISDFDEDRMRNFADNIGGYTRKIKEKIERLSQQQRKKIFNEYIDTDKITLVESYAFPKTINPAKTCPLGLAKSLYEEEGAINGFEERVISKVAALENVKFWTRNESRKGFCINGFLNMYPDFIIKTKKGKWVILETKGDHLDALDKLQLGTMWANKAGNNYRFCLVYDQKEVEGAYRVDEFIELLQQL